MRESPAFYTESSFYPLKPLNMLYNMHEMYF